jgi:hypothetical protein
MLPQPKVSSATLVTLRRGEIEARRLRELASKEGVESLGLKPGQIVRDVDTGTRYKIEDVNVWIRDDGTPDISIRGRRTYKTGRRDAWSATCLVGRNYELDKVPEPA